MDAYEDTPEPIPVEDDGTWTGGGPRSDGKSKLTFQAPEGVDPEAWLMYDRMCALVLAGVKLDEVDSIPDEGVEFIGHLSKAADGSPELTIRRLVPHPLPYTTGRKRGLGVSLFLWRRQLHLSTEDGAQATRDTRTRRLGILAALRSR